MAKNNAIIWATTMIIMNLILSGVFILVSNEDSVASDLFSSSFGIDTKNAFTGTLLDGKNDVDGLSDFSEKLNENTEDIVEQESENIILEGFDTFLNFGSWIIKLVEIIGAGFGGGIAIFLMMTTNGTGNIWSYIITLPLLTMNIYYIAKIFGRDRFGD